MGQKFSAVTTEGGEACHPSAFDKLFSWNVPHILEKIFFSLDYKSFKTCMEVCQTWKDLLESASYQNRFDQLLIQKKNNEMKLLEFSRDGNTEEIRRLISSCTVDVNCVELKMVLSTPLIWAVFNRHIEVVQILLDAGADPNKTSFKLDFLMTSITPLHWAALIGDHDMVRVLLDGGADTNISTASGHDPLYLAICNGHRDVAKTLRDRGAGYLLWLETKPILGVDICVRKNKPYVLTI